MLSGQVNSVILRYYLHRATAWPGFTQPISVLFLLHRGLSFTEIGAVTAATAIAAVASELPTGIVGDRIGRRNSLIISQVLFAVVKIGLVLSFSFSGFLLMYALYGPAETFRSGSNEAWLYETLVEQDGTEQYTHVLGRGEALLQWGGALTMIAGGFLYAVDPVFPFIASVPVNIFSAIVLVTLPKNTQYQRSDDKSFTTLDAIPVVRERFFQAPLRSFVAYAALLFALVRATAQFIQPIAVEVIGPILNNTGFVGGVVSEAAVLGFLYAAFAAVTALASDRASNTEAALGFGRTMLYVPFGTAVFLIVPVALPLLFIPAFFVMKAADGVLRPVVNNYLNIRVDSFGRATVLSTAALLYALVRVPALLLVGALADVTSPRVAVAALAGLFLFGTGVLRVLEPPVGTAIRHDSRTAE